jgi:hypothetical protein
VAEYIFIPDGVAKLMRATGQFPWMPKAPQASGNALKVWFKDDNKIVYWHYHFSVYGKFQEQKVKQLREISELLDTVSSCSQKAP